MRVLIACEFSGIVRDAFRRRGHDAWSCDLLPTERKGQHLQCDVLSILDDGWDMLLFFWPCTLLTRSGCRWLFETPRKPRPGILYGKPRRAGMMQSAKTFRRLLDCSIPKIAGENPRPYPAAKKIMGEESQVIQPWQFGVPENKATCLWLRGLPLLEPTKNVRSKMKRRPVHLANRVHHANPGPNRWKERSRTLPEIAEAMAQQWG